jgi:hypothetical protein
MAMAKTRSRNLGGDALTAHAAKLGIAVEDFRDASGTINELDLQRRVSIVERYASEFHFGKLVVACTAAFCICGVATWLAIHFLAHAG